jgi:Ca2+-binding RTX toxin-like protein
MRSGAKKGARSGGGGGGMEPLERRTLLSSIAIPVLIYHQSEVTKTNADGSSWFEDQVALLDAKGYDSISIDEFRVWHDGGDLPAGVDRPFIAIFDDATPDVLEVDGDPSKGAAAIMSKYGTAARPFRGVSAVPTAQVGAANRLTWQQLRKLTNPIDAAGDDKGFGWEIASHSRNHLWLGDGHPVKRLVPEKFANNVIGTAPQTLAYELAGSKADLRAQALGGENVAFVWPGDDVTARNLTVAAQAYRVVFGESSEIGATTERFIGRTSGLQNGQLYRIGIRATGVGGPQTTLASFGAMLDRAAALTDGTAAFTPKQVQYAAHYLARDGTIVIDGTPGADRIVLGETSFVVNGVTYEHAALKPDYEGKAPDVRGYNVDGLGGNDTIIGSPFSDDIVGGTGKDSISGRDGDDSIYGGDGVDEIDGGAGDDTLSGGAQRDILDGDIGADRLNGNGGHDLLFGGPGGDRLFGFDGNDMLDGGSSTDRLEGGAGADTMYGVGGDDRFFAAGDQTVDFLYGGTGWNLALVDQIDELSNIVPIARHWLS